MNPVNQQEQEQEQDHDGHGIYTMAWHAQHNGQPTNTDG